MSFRLNDNMELEIYKSCLFKSSTTVNINVLNKTYPNFLKKDNHFVCNLNDIFPKHQEKRFVHVQKTNNKEFVQNLQEIILHFLHTQ
jgi:hypothetical protein